jgi:hypothetical protein
MAYSIEFASVVPMYTECAPCPSCKRKPILNVERSNHELQMGVQIRCPDFHEGHLAQAISVDPGTDPLPAIRATLPQLKLWWNDQVAMHHAAEAMKARGGAARGRPGLRPRLGI